MFYFPSIFFIFIALIQKNSVIKIIAIMLSFLTLYDNIAGGWWAADIYSISFVILIFLQNPNFFERWNFYMNQAPKATQIKATTEQIRHYRIAVFIIACSFLFPILGFYTLAYPDYTNLLILLSGVLAFILGTTYLVIVNAGKKSELASSDKDKTMGITVLALLTVWPLSFLALELTGLAFIFPAVVMIILGLTAWYFAQGKVRYLAAGTIVILADYFWRLNNILSHAQVMKASTIGVQAISGLAILAGLIWLLTRPGVKPFLYLALLLSCRYFLVIYQLFTHLAVNLSTFQIVQVTVFQTLWMLITPILLLLIGLRSL